MKFDKFIGRTTKLTEPNEHLPAPYLRKEFNVWKKEGESVKLFICGVGLFEVYINGKNITRGLLNPYFCNPEKIAYYDEYDITELVTDGLNCIGILLGNGMADQPSALRFRDGCTWHTAPKVALKILQKGRVILASDASFKTTDSPIRFNDYRGGEVYDARLELEGFSEVGYDDFAWQNAIVVKAPGGEPRPTSAFPPIKIINYIHAVSVTKVGASEYLYDFNYNTAGLFKLKIRGAKRGQRIIVQAGEWLLNNNLNLANIGSYSPIQRLEYICSGAEEETYIPKFSYYGFRLLRVSGISKKQAVADLLTMLEAHTDNRPCGGFSCSDEDLNDIQNAVVNSDNSNFFHYITDCPTREKCGWTGDASVSCQQFLYNIDCTDSLREWLAHARAEQLDTGSFPCIIPLGVPTYSWGYTVGAVWDSFMIVLCYRLFQHSGNEDILRENAQSILKYLRFVDYKRNEKGLLSGGLSDWLQTDREASHNDSPSVVGVNFLARESSRMAKEIFAILGDTRSRDFAEYLENSFTNAIRANLIDKDLTISGACPTSQALGVWYDIFTPEEMPKAKKRLLEICNKYDNEFAVGMVGTKILPLALTKCGKGDLVYQMFTAKDKPSYTYSLRRFPTALPEHITRCDGDAEKGYYFKYFDYEYPEKHGDVVTIGKKVKLRAFMEHLTRKSHPNSLNHHFLGEPSHWFMAYILGIKVNPRLTSPDYVEIEPLFLKNLRYANGWHQTKNGKVSVNWQKKEGSIVLEIQAEGRVNGKIIMPDKTEYELKSGNYYYEE